MFSIRYVFLFLLFSALVLPYYISAQDHSDSTMHQNKKDTGMDKDTKSDMKGMMQQMHKEMIASKITGDPDKDFAHMMIHHHNGAIKMSQKEVDKGNNPEVKKIAARIIDESKKDLGTLRKFSDSKNDKNGTMDDKQHKMDMMKGMEGMRKKMDMKMSGDMDKDYSSIMIMHHEQSIKMSQNYLDNGNNEELRSLAEKNKDASKKDIEDLKKASK